MQIDKIKEFLLAILIILFGIFMLCVTLIGVAGIYIKIFSEPYYPWDRKNTEWRASSIATIAHFEKFSVSDVSNVTMQHQVSVPVVIIRNFKWPYQEKRDVGEGPWFLSDSNCEDTFVREEMDENGVFAGSPDKVSSVVWLSIEEITKIHKGYVWRGATPLSGSTPISINRKLIARIYDVENSKMITKQSWDCSYAIAPKMTKINNKSSLERACKEMEKWLASLTMSDREP